MDADIRELIDTLHNTTGQIVYVTAGAGTQALSDLLAVAGASRTLLEAVVPYSKNAFIDFVGQEPHKFVSQKAGMLLAGRALGRARELANSDEALVGVSCTATIATDRPKRGEHRAHITTWNKKRVSTCEIVLDKGARNRYGEEQLISRLILNSIADALETGHSLELPLTNQDQLNFQTFSFADAAAQLTSQHIAYFGVYSDGQVKTHGINPQLLLCGSFNPLHAGHVAMAQAASAQIGKPIAFEISAFNVDKPALECSTLLNRLVQFAGTWPIYITSAPTFVEKARMFNNTTFVVGFDTAERIIEPRYYNNSHDEMLAGLTELQTLGCQFLVAGRVNENGVFKTADDLNTPQGYAGLFEALNGFRVDLSSTALRLRQTSSGSASS